jgi:hypothetical protein
MRDAPVWLQAGEGRAWNAGTPVVAVTGRFRSVHRAGRYAVGELNATWPDYRRLVDDRVFRGFRFSFSPAILLEIYDILAHCQINVYRAEVETRCYRVLRKDRNRPLPLAAALALRADGGRLVINEQSHRAAVQVHTASLMNDDGNVEIRTRLIRPMARETIALEQFNRSNWRKATREEFSALWEAECGRVPEFSESAFHIITGLLLPIWDRLPSENMRVYRWRASR